MSVEWEQHEQEDREVVILLLLGRASDAAASREAALRAGLDAAADGYDTVAELWVAAARKLGWGEAAR